MSLLDLLRSESSPVARVRAARCSASTWFHGAGAASAISETAYELGAVLGTAVLGGILSAVYAARVVVPAGLDPAAATSAGETLGGATAVAAALPEPAATQLLDSARHAFDGGVVLTSGIAVVLVLAAAALVWVTLRGQGAES